MAKTKKVKSIIGWIITAIIVFILGGVFSYTFPVDKDKDYEPIEPIEEEPVFGAGEFTNDEIKLLNSIVNDRNTLTINEWKIAPKLLEKMIVKSGISHADYINDYTGMDITSIIRELDIKSR